MFKKVFLVLFALLIIALDIALYLWDSGEAASLNAVTQKATRIEYMQDRSPSFIAFDPLGRVWAYGSDDPVNKNGALVVYKNGKEIGRYTQKDSPVLGWLSYFTTHIGFSSDGTAWFGGTGDQQDYGVAMFDGETWTTFSTATGLPSNWVTAIEVDARGRAWIGLYDNGLAVYDQGEWQFFTAENSGLSVNTISDIAFDDQGRAWIATDRGGVNIFDGAVWKVLNTQNSGLGHDRADEIIFDSQGRAWIATAFDISVYDEGANSWLHYPIASDIGMNGMFFDSTGRFWAPRGQNIHVFDGEQWKYYFDPNFSINIILPDPQGNILMANGYDEIRTVAAQDVDFNLKTASQGQARVFVESGGLLVITILLGLLWLAALFSAWWTMGIAFVLSLPIYLIWISMFGGHTPADAALFSGGLFVWNPGALLCLLIVVCGILGNWFKRSGRKAAEWIGVAIGLTLGIVLNCGLIFLAFIFMAK